MTRTPTVAEVQGVLEATYDPRRAEEWDAVGLVAGDPNAEVNKILFAVDPIDAVIDEAVATDVDLLVTHHPLLLRPVNSVAATTPKGRAVHKLIVNKVALLTAHTNADASPGGVSEAMAHALGVQDPKPIAAQPSSSGRGRIGRLTEPTTLRDFAATVAAALRANHSVARVAGEPDQPIRTVALCGGSGDFLLDEVRATDADVYVTSDLRHHPASELREHGAPALIDVPHWAAEWTWLPVVEDLLIAALAAQAITVETRVSTIVTDPWTSHVPMSRGAPR